MEKEPYLDELIFDFIIKSPGHKIDFYEKLALFPIENYLRKYKGNLMPFDEYLDKGNFMYLMARERLARIDFVDLHKDGFWEAAYNFKQSLQEPKSNEKGPNLDSEQDAEIEILYGKIKKKVVLMAVIRQLDNYYKILETKYLFKAQPVPRSGPIPPTSEKQKARLKKMEQLQSLKIKLQSEIKTIESFFED